jgi:hypothetical protein
MNGVMHKDGEGGGGRKEGSKDFTYHGFWCMEGNKPWASVSLLDTIKGDKDAGGMSLEGFTRMVELGPPNEAVLL